jgi:arylsulfatase A-like enzyme
MADGPLKKRQRHHKALRHYQQRLFHRGAKRSGQGVHRRKRRPRQPFLRLLAPYAPHAPATPAPRDKNTFNGLKAPRLPSFNESDISDKPPWIQSLRRLTSDKIANIDQRHENRVESLQAVADLVRTLGEQGVLSNTYIVFTSDNGFHHGEHRIPLGKGRPHEESVRVPLVIRGPGVVPPPAGQPRLSTDKLVLNTDYFPTWSWRGHKHKRPPTSRAFFGSCPHEERNNLEDGHPDRGS